MLDKRTSAAIDSASSSSLEVLSSWSNSTYIMSRVPESVALQLFSSQGQREGEGNALVEVELMLNVAYNTSNIYLVVSTNCHQIEQTVVS